MRTVKSKCLILTLLLATGFLLAPGSNHAFAASSRQTAEKSQVVTGYEADGRTSASVLVAKRSHTVAKEDETGLAIYSGLFVVGLIVFFAGFFNPKR